MSNRDFTLRKYEELCEAISNSQHTTHTIREYLENGTITNPVILLRHDVDENIRFALDMAKVEAEYGIKATYYLRAKNNTYIPDTIDSIVSNGHEIGYHYETLDDARGDMDLAIQLFAKELAAFREKYDVKTVCMHGNPLSKYDNRDMWGRCRLSDFGLLGEPYLSLDYHKFTYFSDSGRNWDINKNKIKDTLLSPEQAAGVRNTDDLIQLIRMGNIQDICILTHPERWPRTGASYCYRYFVDMVYNVGKWIIVKSRRNKPSKGVQQ